MWVVHFGNGELPHSAHLLFSVLAISLSVLAVGISTKTDMRNSKKKLTSTTPESPQLNLRSNGSGSYSSSHDVTYENLYPADWPNSVQWVRPSASNGESRNRA